MSGLAPDPATSTALLDARGRPVPESWNHTDASFPADRCIHQLVEEQAARTPGSVAVVCEDASLTYAELNERANRLAHRLVRLGVGPEARVGVCLERGAELVVALLAVLKAGGAYVPLDPAYPVERLELMLADAGVAALVTQERLRGLLPVPDGAHVVRVDGAEAELRDESADDPRTSVAPRNLAYLIYTSGSTGRPKGVAIEHQSAVAMLAWAWSVYSDEELGGMLASTSVCFDMSVFELFAPLGRGGRVIVVENALALPRSAAAGQVRLVDTVPSAIATLLETGGIPAGVRTVNLGGELLKPELVDALYAHGIERVYDLYGPSEDTTFSTYALRRPGAEPTIGRPIANARCHVVHADLRPAGVGEAGELYMAGKGITRGYLGRPGLTAGRYLPDPFADEPGARMYRTGDRVRWRDDGTLEYLGRLDHQLKIRGYRVEPGEIEAVLREHPGVHDVVVAPWQPASGDRRLAAYLVPRIVGGTDADGTDGDGRLAAAELVRDLRRAARDRLPEYMVPSVFVPMERFPLSPNGKVDRRALPEPPGRPDGVETPFVAPRTETEAQVAAIWSEVLGAGAVGVEDDVFTLGAHSLAVTQAASRLRARLGVELPFRELFAARTVAALAQAVERRRAEAAANPEPAAAAITRAPPEARLPLSFSQERIWFLLQLAPESLSYNFQATLTLRGRLDGEALRCALQEIVRRHEIFRTTFPADRGEPYQQVHSPFGVDLPLTDLSALDAEARAEEERRILRDAFAEVFGITQLPLVRWRLIRRAQGEHVLLHVEHHLVHDGWSFNVFLRELLALYGAFSQGLPSPLPELPLQFGDYAHWQRRWLQGPQARRQLDFWRERLAGSSHLLEMAFDRERPAEQRFCGAAPRYELPAELYDGLRAASRRTGVTLFATMMAAFNVLLWRWSGQTDLNVGTGIANRRPGEIQGLLGMFVNSVVVRTTLDDDPAFEVLARRVHEEIVAAADRQEMPFEAVVEAVRPARSLSHNPLFQASFSFHDAPIPELALPGLRVEVAPGLSNGSAKFDLNVIAIPRAEQRVGQGRVDDADGITLIWEYSGDLFDPATIERMVAEYRALLQSAAAGPATPVSRLPAPAPAARERGTAAAAPAFLELSTAAGGGVHRAFERRVRQAPGAPALVAGGERLSRAELDARAEQLARRLRRRGVGRETVVGVCTTRSAQLAVGVLGVLKAGGVYLPLDPAYPADRLAYMLEDSSARVLVAERCVAGRLPRAAASLLLLDDAGADDEGADTAPAETLPGDGAYLIYTSGSTGAPKGVLVEHGAAAAHCAAAVQAYGLTAEDAVLHFASASFDASLEQLLAPLSAGARVVVRGDAMPSPDEVAALVADEGLTVVNPPTGMWEQLVHDPASRAALARVRLVIAGGDVMSPSAVRAWNRAAPSARLLNAYGPTEAVVTASAHTVPADFGGERVPVGRALPGRSLYVVDAYGARLAAGAPGELCIGGALLARGYLRRPGLTAERFVPDPFSPQPGARMYRTGDRAAWRADGALDFIDRMDAQVKVRGFRIEPGEVEAALRAHPGVAACAVVAREDAPGQARLVAYVTGGADAAGLRAHLRGRLPEHMVPGAFVRMDALPLTPNGKLDRAALPVPEHAPAAAVPPRGEMEERVAETWREALGMAAAVGAHDDFFDVGGTSLMMPRIHARLRDLHPGLRMVELFRHRTVASLAAHLSQARGGGAAAAANGAAPAPSAAAEARPPAGAAPCAAVAATGFAGPTEDAAPADGPALRVAEVWRAVLGASRVGVDDNFFDLGGTSLLMYRVFVRLRELRPGLGVTELFRDPTVAGHAALLRPAASAKEPDAPAAPPQLIADAAQTATPAPAVSRGGEPVPASWPAGPAQDSRALQELIARQLEILQAHAAIMQAQLDLLRGGGAAQRPGLAPPEDPHTAALTHGPGPPAPDGPAAHPPRVSPDAFASGSGGDTAASGVAAPVAESAVAAAPGGRVWDPDQPPALDTSAGHSPPPSSSPRAAAAFGDGEVRVLPASFAQERLWLIDQMQPGLPVYSIRSGFRLHGALDVPALERALGGVVRRHEALRTTMAEADGAPVQVVHPFTGFRLPLVDLFGGDAAQRDARVRERVRMQAEQPLDLAAGPVFRAELLRLAGDEHVLLLCVHHAVADGWSLGVLFAELAELYAAAREGREPALAPVAMQFADFARLQREQANALPMRRSLAYWRARLAGAPALLELSADFPRPAEPSYRGAHESIDLPAEVLDALRALSRAEHVSPFMVLLAAFQALVSRLSGREDVVVGTPAAGRARSDARDAIGMFADLLALRTDLGGDPAFRGLLARVRDEVVGALEHQEAPFDRVVRVVRPERSPAFSPLVQAVFTMEERGRSVPALAGLRVEPVEMDYPAAKFDLVLMVETEAAFRAGIVYRTDLFRPATVRRMLAAYRRVLEQAAADPDVRLSALALQADPEDGDRSADVFPLPGSASADVVHPAETVGVAGVIHLPQPVVRSLAVDGVHQPSPPAEADGRAMPLSFAQERLWFLDRMEPGSAFYNIPAARRLEGALDVAALERALGEIVRRHDALRTTFHAVDGSPVQVAAPFAGFALAADDVSALGPEAREAEVRRRVDEDAARPFDLAAGPPFRAALLRLGDHDHLLLLCLHHVAGDGWSLEVLFRELGALYEAFAAGAASPLADLPVRYADFAARQRAELRGEALERLLAYWRARLADAPALLDLPTDRPRPALQTYRGARERIDLPPALLDALRAAGRTEGATPYMVILAAFQALLARYARSEDVVVGSTIAGRTRAEVEEVVGVFVNTLVLRTDLSGDPTFRQLLRRVRETALGAWEHQELPFERLVAELRPERSPSHAPLCQVAFSMGDAPRAAPALGGVRMTPVDAGQTTAKFDLGLGVLAGEGEFHAMLSYATELWDRATAARMLRQLAGVLEQAAADPDRRLSELDLLTDDERRQVMQAWSAGEPVPPSAACVHDLFAAQAARTPESVAVVHRAARLSYGELDARSARLARHLRGLGVGPETRVGVCLERTPELAVALLGILRAGGAYVPLDPAYPQERLGWMMEDAEARLAITSTALAPRLPGFAEPLRMDALGGVLDAGPSTPPESGTGPQNLSHVIFTSGSTGRPKGVMIRHSATVARLHWLRDAYSAEERAAVAASTSINFDVSVPEIFGTLCWGGTMVLLENALELPSVGVPVTMAAMVPTAAAELLRAGDIPASVRTLSLGGEPLSPAVAAAAHATGALRRLLNLYGPTEDTSYSTWSAVEPGADRVRIGRPLAGTRAYVLDSALRPVPPGIPGELYLAGAGLARGYARRPARTAESFLPDPFGPPGARMYRVLDLARWTDGGELECLGRTDFQVKVRGYRIEPGEIEAALRAHPEVKEAAVVARDDAPGGRRLVAYVTGGAEPAALRAHLRGRLPEYMVPSAWVALRALPRTPNGKLDRRALPAPAAPAAEGRRLEPETEVEARLAGVWKELLGVARLGVEDNFFDLGGHSLLLVRLQSRLAAEFGCGMRVIELFQYPTVRALAARVQGREPAPQAAEVENGEARGAARQAGLGRLGRSRRAERTAEGAGAPPEAAEGVAAFTPSRNHASVPAIAGAEKTYPASFAQERLWFLDRLQPGSPAYNTIAAQRIKGELDVAALERALGEIVRRHEVLRTTFGEVDGAPVQVVAPFAGFRLPVEELSALAPAEREAEVDRWIRAEARRAPDLREPLFRPRLLRLDAREHVLLLPVHHLVGDGPGTGVLAREMLALYAAFHAGRPSPLPPLPSQYGDFALWQREQLRDGVLERQLSYWRERLAAAPARLDLPLDFPRPAVQEHRGDSEHVKLSPALMERLRALAAAESCTPFMLMLAALAVLLSRYGGTEDVVVGTPISNRTRPRFQELIGYFANMLPLRTDLRGDPGFRALLRRVRAGMVGAFAHAEVPFERLVQEFAPGRTLDRMPLFQVIIVSPRADTLDADLPGLVLRGMHFPMTVSKCDLMLAVAAHAGEVWLTYDTDLFRRETAAGMVDDLRRVLEQVAAEPDVRLSAMALPGAERAAGTLAGQDA